MKEKIDRAFKEWQAIADMVGPAGFVAVQDFKRLLDVAKTYRKWCHRYLDEETIDKKIKIPKLKTVEKLREEEEKQASNSKSTEN